MQRFSGEQTEPEHGYVDDSPWYMIHPGMVTKFRAYALHVCSTGHILQSGHVQLFAALAVFVSRPLGPFSDPNMEKNAGSVCAAH